MEKETNQMNQNSNSNSSSKKEENIQLNKQNTNENANSISITKELTKDKNSNSINQEDANVKIVNRLEEIFKKYKTKFENQDKVDFESIIESLRSNLDE
jgi:hypothetical protein